MPPLILGSSSPRRAQFLQMLGVDFRQVKPAYDEQVLSLAPFEVMKALAGQKLTQLRSYLQERPDIEAGLLLVADTLVFHEGIALGKPTSQEHAAVMLQSLSGATHEVMTSVAIAPFTPKNAQRQVLEEGVTDIEVVTTSVQFRTLSAFEIKAYIETGEPMDKAGAYGLQGLGGAFVAKVDGSVSGVVGLPLAQTAALLTKWGQPHTLSGAKS